MSKHKRIGIILVLLGLCIPLLLLGFATKINDNLSTNYLFALQHVNPPQEDIVDKIQNLEIVLREKQSRTWREEERNEFDPQQMLPAGLYPVTGKEINKISIHYKYIFASGIICLFIGIGFIILGNKSYHNDTGAPD